MLCECQFRCSNKKAVSSSSDLLQRNIIQQQIAFHNQICKLSFPVDYTSLHLMIAETEDKKCCNIFPDL